jgi:hypothetical protein
LVAHPSTPLRGAGARAVAGAFAGVKLGLRPRFARRCRGSLDSGEASGSRGGQVGCADQALRQRRAQLRRERRRGTVREVSPDESSRREERTRRRKARELIGAYHEQQLLTLLEHVRDGFARLDAGEIDAFELDDLIHRYKRSARELWKFCGQSGAAWERAVSMLALLREEGDEPDWWQAGEPRRRE